MPVAGLAAGVFGIASLLQVGVLLIERRASPSGLYGATGSVSGLYCDRLSSRLTRFGWVVAGQNALLFAVISVPQPGDAPLLLLLATIPLQFFSLLMIRLRISERRVLTGK